MPRRGNAAVAVLLTTLTLGTCVFPTERDDAVQVSIAPLNILIRGTDTLATATAWRILSPTDSQPIRNVAFVWSSSDPLVASVDAAGHVVAIKSGTTILRAAAANFDAGSRAGVDTLRVSAPLEIDSIRPQAVKYGQTVTVYGVGVDSIFQASIGNAVLLPYFFSNVRDPTGYAQIAYWVPPPAHSDSLFFIGNGVFGFSADMVEVTRRDLYEQNEAAPTVIDLETSRPFPGTALDFLLFLNPALAFEVLPRDILQGADWYQLRQSTNRDLTIVINSDVPGTFQTFLTDSLGFGPSGYFIGDTSWTFGPQSHSCKGATFAPKEAPSESTVVALKDFPAGALDAIAVYTQPGRYALSVGAYYAVAGKGINRDAHEEDDFCNAADAKRVVLAPSYSDMLTIDNPHDVDWIRFTVPGPGGQVVRFQTAARPLAAADSSDIDLYVLDVPAAGDTVMNLRGGVAQAGSTVDTSIPLPPGDYYAVVVDFAGVPTRYAICIGTGGSCSLPPAPPVAGLQAAITRRARLETAIQRRGPARIR